MSCDVRGEAIRSVLAKPCVPWDTQAARLEKKCTEMAEALDKEVIGGLI